VDDLIDEYTNVLYDTTLWKIDNSESKEKEELKKYYSNKALMKEYDAKELRYALGDLGLYTPYKLNEKKEIVRPEQLHITRVLPSDKLMRPHDDFDTDSWLAPPPMSSLKYKEFCQRLISMKSKKINDQFNEVHSYLNDSTAQSKLKEIQVAYSMSGNLVNDKLETWEYKYLINSPDNKGRARRSYDELISMLNDNRELFYATFQHSDYDNYFESKLHKRLPSMDSLFFTDADFTLSDLEEVPEVDSITQILIYQLVLEELGNSEIPKYDPKYWIAFDTDNQPIIARKTKGEFCRAICDWAYSDAGDDFLLHSGIPPKDRSKGIYKYTTFARDYLKNSFQERMIRNYRFSNLHIDVKKLEEFKQGNNPSN
jgi:hypothetical protein